jgi:hypothetical protein
LHAPTFAENDIASVDDLRLLDDDDLKARPAPPTLVL